jgi:Ca-activated chloride channel family protein
MNAASPHFAEPVWLWLAVLAPLGILLLQGWSARQRKKQLAKFAAPELATDLLQNHSRLRREIKNLLLVLAMLGFGVALARPQWGETVETSHALGEDLLFLIDCSRSVQPNRLQRSQYAILNFVQQYGRGRVGLIAFAGQAFLQCPLTFDYDAFRESLLAVDTETIPSPGTDIGRALDEAERAMEKDERRKIVVLLTDGEDLEKSGAQAAQALAKKHFVIYTVGVGTAAGSSIRVPNDKGGLEFVRDSSGNIVQSRLDETTLTAIAQATKGAYHPLGIAGEGLNAVRRLIDESQESAKTISRKTGTDRFHIPIAGILLLLVGESLIGTRRKLHKNRNG